jgi:hypothetical protein
MYSYLVDCTALQGTSHLPSRIKNNVGIIKKKQQVVRTNFQLEIAGNLKFHQSLLLRLSSLWAPYDTVYFPLLSELVVPYYVVSKIPVRKHNILAITVPKLIDFDSLFSHRPVVVCPCRAWL